MPRTVTSPAGDLLWLAAGVIAGAFGSAGGITSLISFPALLTIRGHGPCPALVEGGSALGEGALENVILGVADVVAAIGFAVFGPVRWAAAVPLALGLFAGSRFGPSPTRRIPGGALRVAAEMAGLGLAIERWLYPR